MVKRILSIALVVMMLTSLFAVNAFAATQIVETNVFTQNFDTGADKYDNVKEDATGVYGDNKWAYDNRNGRGSGSLADAADGGKEVKIESRGDAQANFIVYLPSTIFEAGKKYKAEIQVRPDLFITNAATLATDISFTTGANRSASDISGTAKTYNVANGTATTIETDFFEYDASFAGKVINVRLDLDVNMSQQTKDVDGATKKNEFVYFDNLVIYAEDVPVFPEYDDSIFKNTGSVDFDDLMAGYTLDDDDAWFTKGGTSYATISDEQSVSGSNSMKVVLSSGTQEADLKDVFTGIENGKLHKITMKIYPLKPESNVGTGLQIGTRKGVSGDEHAGIRTVYDAADNADLAALTLGFNQWNTIEMFTSTNEYEVLKFFVPGGMGYTKGMTFYVDDITYTKLDCLSLETDAGYYAVNADDDEKDGVVAVYGQVVNGTERTAEYGLYFYDSTMAEKVNLTANDADELRANAGKFHALVEGVDDFEATFIVKPFVKINGLYIYGDILTVNTADVLNKWLGPVTE